MLSAVDGGAAQPIYLCITLFYEVIYYIATARHAIPDQHRLFLVPAQLCWQSPTLYRYHLRHKHSPDLNRRQPSSDPGMRHGRVWLGLMAGAEGPTIWAIWAKHVKNHYLLNFSTPHSPHPLLSFFLFLPSYCSTCGCQLQELLLSLWPHPVLHPASRLVFPPSLSLLFSSCFFFAFPCLTMCFNVSFPKQIPSLRLGSLFFEPASTCCLELSCSHQLIRAPLSSLTQTLFSLSGTSHVLLLLPCPLH